MKATVKVDGKMVNAAVFENGNYLTDELYARGEYQETDIDKLKKAADILVTGIDDKFTIFLNNTNVVVPTRGTEKYSEKLFAVTERTLDTLKREYNVMYDL